MGERNVKVWQIPVTVSVEASTESKARLTIQNRLGVDDRVKRYHFDRGAANELASLWRPISTAPKKETFLGLEGDLGYAFTAEWSEAGVCWMNLTANEKTTQISHWMPQPPLSESDEHDTDHEEDLGAASNPGGD
jgi:hypothetical protein